MPPATVRAAAIAEHEAMEREGVSQQRDTSAADIEERFRLLDATLERLRAVDAGFHRP
jgi:hypothetical protein